MILLNASESRVLQFIAESPSKVSFGCLKRHFKDTHLSNPKKLKQLVAGLIQTGQLCYTSHFGQSFIEISFDQPWAVSEHVFIAPPLCSLKVPSDHWIVSLNRGASFGGGEHPTTRLAIQLIDALLSLPSWRDQKHLLKAVDIGTGSGILAIVAAKMGVGFVCGIDTDPCSVFESRSNVRLNHLEDRINISDDDLDAIPGMYDLVIANLRLPTLFGLRTAVEKKLDTDSVLIFSGLKIDETRSLCDYYEEAGFYLHQKLSKKGWSALCLTRGLFPDRKTESMLLYS